MELLHHSVLWFENSAFHNSSHSLKGHWPCMYCLNTYHFLQSITVISVIPPITLHASTMGNHLFLTDVSDPWTDTLQPLILKCVLAHHPDKAFVQQLTFILTHGCAIGYIRTRDQNSQLMLNTLV